MSHTLEEIRKSLDDWVDKWIRPITPLFRFRPGQRELIESIILNILVKKDFSLLEECPTGSGKSFIAVISAGVLWDTYKKTSYILCSDIFLWKQYEDLLDKYQLPWGRLKGQDGNYTCEAVKGENIKYAKCKLNKESWAALANSGYARKKGYECAETCQYVLDRRKAIASGVTLMTYHLFVTHLNMTNIRKDYKTEIGDNIKYVTFGPRDVVFCDECHNLPGIMQMYSNPVVSVAREMRYISTLASYYYDNDDLLEREKDSIKGILKNIAEVMTDMAKAPTQDTVALYNVLEGYVRILENRVSPMLFEVESSAEKLLEIHEENQGKKLSMLKVVTQVRNTMQTLRDYLGNIENLGVDSLVAAVIPRKIGDELGSITYKCAYEHQLCQKYFWRHVRACVLLSATIGNHYVYQQNVGKDFDWCGRVPSTFDYTTSPIYCKKGLKFSYNNKEYVRPKICQLVYDIMDNPSYQDLHGIIHTASYENAKYLYDNAPKSVKKRLMLYEESKAKEKTIEDFKKKPNTVLIGPTLTEGIDLPGDLCRFMCIIKMPYPSLGDPLIKAKRNLFPGWYESTTSNNIIQSVGRGNRTPDDWCVTFILDDCFSDLYKATWQQYPEEFRKRLQTF